jgi:DNA modification methylase
MDLILGNCKEEMKKIESDSIDSIVTDPPYELGFMGKKWDSSGIAYDVEVWSEALRILKPGGHLLAFGGARTHHRMMVAIEDAGFEIRDCLMWLYGSGFPKNHNISKAIDKSLGAERKVIGQRQDILLKQGADLKRGKRKIAESFNAGSPERNNGFKTVSADVTAPATPEAQQWDGWGTALKPAHEPIVLARKPLTEKTIVKNVLKYNTGAMNIDSSRVFTEDVLSIGSNNRTNATINFGMRDDKQAQGQHKLGRFPANIILECICDEVIAGENEGVVINNKNSKSANDTIYKLGISQGEQDAPRMYKDTGDIHTNPECPCYILNEQAPSVGNAYNGKRKKQSTGGTGYTLTKEHKVGESAGVFDGLSGASKFFYCAKASKGERNEGLDIKNTHPTVKPIKLMEYLVRLITPPNGKVLDPFMGSGSTGCACVKLGFDFTGIELSEESFLISQKRIDYFKGNQE